MEKLKSAVLGSVLGIPIGPISGFILAIILEDSSWNLRNYLIGGLIAGIIAGFFIGWFLGYDKASAD